MSARDILLFRQRDGFASSFTLHHISFYFRRDIKWKRGRLISSVIFSRNGTLIDYVQNSIKTELLETTHATITL
jgi:hypothetical protein